MLILALALQSTTMCQKLYGTVTCNTYGSPAVIQTVPVPVSPKPQKQYPQRVPNGRELYTGCNLFLEGEDVPSAANNLPPFSAIACALTANAVLQNNDKMPVASRFCPRGDKPIQQMIAAFVRIYADWPKGKEDRDGFGLMFGSTAALWSCPLASSPAPARQ